jgi:hypothetical protein
MQVNLARGADRDWIVRRLTELSAEFGTRMVEGPQAVSVVL